MRILFLGLFLAIACAEFDPFDYGNFINDEELKLYGLMKESANFNGKWHKIHTTFEVQGISFEILKIQDSCVFLREIPTQQQSKICLQESKLLRN